MIFYDIKVHSFKAQSRSHPQLNDKTHTLILTFWRLTLTPIGNEHTQFMTYVVISFHIEVKVKGQHQGHYTAEMLNRFCVVQNVFIFLWLTTTLPDIPGLSLILRGNASAVKYPWIAISSCSTVQLCGFSSSLFVHQFWL